VQVAFEPARFRRSVLVALGLVSGWLLALWMFHVVGHFLFLLLLAWLLAIAMEPGIAWFMRRGLNRGPATAVIGGLAIMSVLVLAAVFGAEFINQLTSLVRGIPGTVTSVVDWLDRTFHLHLDAAQITSKLHVTPGQAANWASSVAGGVLGWAGSLLSVLFDLLIVAVFMFYFAAAGPRLVESIAVWLPPERQRVVATISQIAVHKTGGYVISKIELAAVSAFFHGLLFWLIGVPGWLPLALLVGITAQFIPVVGTYIGIIIPVLVSIFDKPLNAVWIIAFAAVYQQIETYFLTPRISRRTMDVNPAIALAAVFAGAAIWGPLGALIGIPIAAAGVAAMETYGHRYELTRDLVETPTPGV